MGIPCRSFPLRRSSQKRLCPPLLVVDRVAPLRSRLVVSRPVYGAARRAPLHCREHVLHSCSHGIRYAALKAEMSEETFVRSTLGNQVVGGRNTAPIYSFGTSTREKAIRMYISPAHLKESYGRASPAPDTYTLQSSLGRQVLDQKVSYPARSFGMGDRFDRDRRDARAAQTPGPGAYRI